MQMEKMKELSLKAYLLIRAQILHLNFQIQAWTIK